MTIPELAAQRTTRGTPETEAAARTSRTRKEDVVPSPAHSMAHVPSDYRTINGWGADLDPADRPAVPRELPSDVLTLRGDPPHWQEPRFKIHNSNEQPGLTPVFGESCPPHGLSKRIRNLAYEYSEGTNRHWLILMAADRVDIIETSVADLFRGRGDRYIKEKGWSAIFRYGDAEQKRGFLLRLGAVLGTAVVAAGVLVKAARD